MMSDVSMGPAVCRICMCGETSIPYLGKEAGEPLISPCICCGTMGLYHRSCLEHWLTLTKTQQCEICKFTFQTAQRKRPFLEYIRMKGYEKARSDGNYRNPYVDALFLLLVSPVAWTALYLCLTSLVKAGKRYHNAFENKHFADDQENIELRNEISMQFLIFLFVSIIIFFSYSSFLIAILCNNWAQFKKWQRKNKAVFIVDKSTEREKLKLKGAKWVKEMISFNKGQLTSSRNISRQNNNQTLIRMEPAEGIIASNAGPVMMEVENTLKSPSTNQPNSTEATSSSCIRNCEEMNGMPRFKGEAVYSVSSGIEGVACSTPVHDRFHRIMNCDPVAVELNMSSFTEITAIEKSTSTEESSLDE